MGRGKLIAEVGKSTIIQHTSVRVTNYIPKNNRKDGQRMEVKELQDSSGRTWQEVSSKAYSLKEIADYLQDCMEEPQKDTAVYFTIRDGGDLAIITRNEEKAGEIEATGFTELQEGGNAWKL